MKRHRDDEDIPDHCFEASDQDVEAFVRLDTLFEIKNIRQIMFSDFYVRWHVTDPVTKLFTSFNRFGLEAFSTVFDDGKLNFNIHGRPDIFSKFQLQKLNQHNDQILVFSGVITIREIFQAVVYFYWIQKLLQHSNIHPLRDYIMSFLKFRCSTFTFAKHQQMQLHCKNMEEKRQKSIKEAKMQELAKQFLG
jgi:hypothetical protein